MLKIISPIVIMTFLITACGGGGSDEVKIQQGQFKDSTTSGVNYVSGDIKGVTREDGGFTYESGKPIYFSIGKVELGSSIGKEVITPVDLVPEGNFNSIKVQNIVRFLMMLDEDTNPATGINISTAVQTVAKTWSPIDFESQEFENNLIDIIADVTSVEEKVHPLPTAEVAKSHLKSSFLCAYSGVYKGSFSGDDDQGSLGGFVNALSGDVKVLAFSMYNQGSIETKSIHPLGYETSLSFIAQSNETSFLFKGDFSSKDRLAGIWEDNSHKGNFSSERIGGDNKASYRFSARYSGGDNDYGLFSFDIDTLNQVTGLRYSILQDKLLNIVSGELSDTKLIATLEDGSSITGNLDITTGKLKGGWMNTAEGLFGSFEGTGCRLN